MCLPGETPWALPGIIPLNGLVVLASAPKTGKSVFANAICRAMATGGEFAGTRWRQKVPILWCAHEETREERAPLLAGLTPEDPYYLAISPEIINLDDACCDDALGRRWDASDETDFEPYLYRKAAKLGIKFMVIDCLHAAVRRSDLSQNHVARRIMGKLRRWSTEYGITTMVLHHLTKSSYRGYHPERFADSSQILASASCHFFLESETRSDGKFQVTLYGAGRLPVPPIQQTFVADDLFTYRYEFERERRRPETTAERVLALLEQGWELTALEIAQKLAANPKTIQNILANHPNVDVADQSEKRHRYRWCSSPSPRPEP